MREREKEQENTQEKIERESKQTLQYCEINATGKICLINGLKWLSPSSLRNFWIFFGSLELFQ